MLLSILHQTTTILYIALPATALVWAIISHRAGRRQVMTSYLITTLAGTLLAIAMAVVYAYVAGGRPVPLQVLLASYFATGLLLLLKCFDWTLTLLSSRLFCVQRPVARGFRATRPERITGSSADTSDVIDDKTTIPASAGFTAISDAPYVTRPRALGMRILGMQVVRIGILFAIGLPYVMASVMTYRVKVSPTDDPMSQLGFRFERVEFAATDGTKLVGWWIPAAERSGRLERKRGPERESNATEDASPVDRQRGSQTVIVCHGLAASKANQLVMARDYPSAGYNVLIFDFRAHGESGGQLTTFGDFERRDVLGAVKYLRAERPQQSQRILGVGASMGAASLIAAATDASPEGQAIEAIAVYGTFDHLGKLSHSVADLYFAPPMDWLLTQLAVPMATVQTGARIQHFAPASLVSKLWPRPILFIHGIDDEIIPFEHGRDLYDAATLPKSHVWLPRMSHNSIIVDETASQAVLQFFKTAEDVPVI